MMLKKNYPMEEDAQIEYLKEKLNKNNLKSIIKLTKKLGVDLGKRATKEKWLTECCKKLVRYEGQVKVSTILPK